MKALIAACLLLVLAPASLAAELRVGAASEVITPEMGVPMAGYYSARYAEGVADELYAKAIVLERDGVRAALVVCDLVTLPRQVTEDARAKINAGSGIAPDHVMISATHTHTGPTVIRASAQDPIEADASAKSKAYTDALPGKIAAAVANAVERLAPAKASIGVGHVEGLSFNRRYFMTDGTVGWNPGKMNPKIVKPAGPIDPDVPVVYFESAEGKKPLATHVSFAMHLDTVGGQRISADYPATLAKVLAEAKGPDMLTVFATGACGDINHVNFRSPEKQEGGTEAARIGKALGGEAVKTLSSKLAPAADGTLRAKNTIVKLPLPEVKPGEVEAARQVILKPSKSRMMIDRVQAYKVLDVAARKGTPIEAEVQVVALGGDVAWVALPGEIFVELGLDIKKRSPFKRTIIVELANGSVGYVPTKRAYAEGNYEPISARCAVGSGEMIADAAVRLLEELHAAK